jgi:nitroreductase/NAD-dependent dihydropyrimidine dehydrogenase PreA subunit
MKETGIITLDPNKCNRCGLCIRRFDGYCISEDAGMPVIDYRLCNVCQKCVAICPSRAFLVNHTEPVRIEGQMRLEPEELRSLLSRRRSIKVFLTNEKLSKPTIQEIVSVAKYAPNQHKNIDAVVITSVQMLDTIDQRALRLYKRIYTVLFSVKVLTWIFRIFSSDLFVTKRKMEYDLFVRKQILKPGAQALVVLVGNKKAAVTESSAQYLLATMIIFAESIGIGTCLMDSIKIVMNLNKKIRKEISVEGGKKVLGVLALGHSAEKIVNIPRGYELNILWV